MDEIAALRQNIIKLCRRSAVDMDFRKLCLEDAKAAYLELTGEILPTRHAVRFIEPESDSLPVPGGCHVFRLPGYLKKTWLS